MKIAIWVRFIILAAIIMVAFAFVAQAEAATPYTVKPGDTLWKISQAHGVPLSKLQAANGWPAVLYVGQTLTIPGVNSGGTYIVKAGDTLWLIAKRYGTTVTAIKSANGLTSDYLYVGQTLTIPGQVSTPAPAPGVGKFTAEEMQLLAQIVHAEAQGEPYAGQVGVAAVVLNRIKDSRFPNTLKGVLFQTNAFSPVAEGTLWNTPSAASYKAALDAVNGYDPTYNAVYFFNPAGVGPNSWMWTRTVTVQIGNHIFAK